MRTDGRRWLWLVLGLPVLALAAAAVTVVIASRHAWSPAAQSAPRLVGS